MTVRSNLAPVAVRFRRLSAKLSRLGAGEPAAATAAIVGEEIGAAIVLALGPHRRSGNAEGATLIQTSAKGVKVIVPYYLKFHPSWWEPFTKAGLPVAFGPRSIVVWKEQVRALLRE